MERPDFFKLNNGEKVKLPFSNQEYKISGAQICKTSEEVYNNSDMILKVKEPIETEYNKIKENQIDQEFKANETIFKMEKRLKHVTAQKLNLELHKIPILKAKLKLNTIDIKNNEKEIKTEDNPEFQGCNTKFQLTVRRHHCRCCGGVLCSRCSANKAPIKYLQFDRVRVCNTCFEELKISKLKH